MITIFTPTYNRGEKLSYLYKSLMRQTDKNFLWLIIDDGSNDNTKNRIEKWKDNLNIKYIYQENSGKHIAINMAIKNCQTKYLICVDSDDTLKEDAVYIINNYLLNEFNNNIWGIVGPRVNKSGTMARRWMIEENTICKFADLYCKYKYKGETYIIFNCDFLKEFSFPKFENEKLVPENVLYDYLDKKAFIKATDKLFYISEYYSDGYTMNSKKKLKNLANGIALANLSAACNESNDVIKKSMSYARYKVIKRVFNIKSDIKEYSNYQPKMLIVIISKIFYPLLYIHYLKKRDDI